MKFFLVLLLILTLDSSPKKVKAFRLPPLDVINQKIRSGNAYTEIVRPRQTNLMGMKFAVILYLEKMKSEMFKKLKDDLGFQQPSKLF